MKAYLNIIYKKEFSNRIREQIECFAHFLNAEVICIEEKEYWKEEKCYQVSSEILLSECLHERIKDVMTMLWVDGQAINYLENQEFLEIAVYSPISDILQQNKVFVVLNIVK